MIENIFQITMEIHKLQPELRFQQIMSIAAKYGGWKNNYDLFYCPDSVIAEGLSLFLQEVKENGSDKG